MEDAHHGSLLGRVPERAAADLMAPLPRAVEGGQQDRPVRELELDPDAGLAEADQVAIVAGPERATCQPEVDRFQQVRLPRSVWAVHHDDGRGRLDPRVGEVAEAAAVDRTHHHRYPYTLRRIGITR